MGHYDSFYEADAEKRAKELKKERKEALKKLEEFLEKAEHLLPDHHLGYLADIEINLKYHSG